MKREKINRSGTSNAPCLLGAHFSIAEGLHNAIYTANKFGCNALQIFTKNANTWKDRTLSQNDIDRFELAKQETGIEAIATHTSYLINLAAIETRKHAMAVNALAKELIRSSMLCILSLPFECHNML